MAVVPYVRATHSDGQSWSAAKANLLEAGVNDVSFAPAVRVYHNTTQSITTGTDTAVAFNSERFDQAGNAADTMHDTVTNNSRLTCRYAGVYQITGHLEWASNATGVRQIWIRFGGATRIADGEIVVAADDGVGRSVVTTLYALAVNDYVELMAFQSSGAGLNIASSSNKSPEFMMARLA